VGMPQRVNVRGLVDPAAFDGAGEGALETAVGDGTDRRIAGRGQIASRDRGKEPEGIAMGAPVVAEQRERGIRDRHVAILAALAMDVQELPLAIDIGDLEANALREPEATGVDRGEADAVDGDADAGENPPDLVAAQDDREFL